MSRYGRRDRGRTTGVDLSISRGEVLVLMGRNGSGKSTLLTTLSGARQPTRGSVVVDGRDPRSFRPAELIRHVGLVPQDPGLLLYGESVQAECRTSDKASALEEGTTSHTLERILPGMPSDRHPRDLSGGTAARPRTGDRVGAGSRPPAARRTDTGAGLPQQGSPHCGPTGVG